MVKTVQKNKGDNTLTTKTQQSQRRFEFNDSNVNVNGGKSVIANDIKADTNNNNKYLMTNNNLTNNNTTEMVENNENANELNNDNNSNYNDNSCHGFNLEQQQREQTNLFDTFETMDSNTNCSPAQSPHGRIKVMCKC